MHKKEIAVEENTNLNATEECLRPLFWGKEDPVNGVGSMD